MTTVRCVPYHCTLTTVACAKRHLATIANRGGRSSDAYPSCRRCPVGAANAQATGAEHVSAYQVRHAPVEPMVRCAVPGCDGTTCERAASSRITPEFARLCAPHRRKAHNERERGATHAEALACVVEGRRYVRATAARVSLRCATPGCEGDAGRTRKDSLGYDALCPRCRVYAKEMRARHRLTVDGAIAHLAAVRRGERPAPVGRPRRSA